MLIFSSIRAPNKINSKVQNVKKLPKEDPVRVESCCEIKVEVKKSKLLNLLVDIFETDSYFAVSRVCKTP